MSEFQPSKYQEAIYNDVTWENGHTVVIARAGSGKTTTIVQSLRRVPVGCRTLLVAFNKSIERDLSAKAPRGVDVRTLHGFGFGLLRRALGQIDLEEDKVRNLCAEFGIRLPREEAGVLRKGVSLAKATLAESEEDVLDLVDTYDLDVPESRAHEWAQHVLFLLEACADRPQTVDFDDMVWLPVRMGLRPRGFDRMFVDETQDLNRCQVELALAAVRETGRVCAVGDDRQAIYGWRGADPAAVPRLVERLKARVLPLSVCYRCPRAVVEEARQYVPDIEAAPGAAEGMVLDATASQLQRDAQPGDFVLSRTNAPLVSLCLEWLAEGRPATIAGRDIGASLSSMVRRSEARSVPELVTWVEAWEVEEVKRLMKKDLDTAPARDRAACLIRLAHGARSVEEVIGRIDRLFDDKDARNQILLSSTHRAKGLERPRVWMLSATYRPEQGVEEENLAYVAVTRAQRELRLVA